MKAPLRFRPYLHRLVNDERGSASVEFSILAIPLFIPLFIFISQFASTTDAQESLRTLARESVRAFVSSENDATAYFVSKQIVEKGGSLLGHTDIEMRFTCSHSPCISPNSQVIVRLISKDSKTGRAEVAAMEYVSPWA